MINRLLHQKTKQIDLDESILGACERQDGAG